MKSRLARPSSRMTLAIALKSATSVPGRSWIHRSAWSQSSMRLGLTTISLRAAAHGPAQANGDDRVVGRGVGAHDHQAARLLVVLVGVRRRARAHRGQHGLDRGRVAEPRAVVHVVGAHDHARELLDDVAVLVGGLGRGEGAEAAVVPRQAVGGRVERLVPRHLAPLAVAPDHGRGDAVARVDEARAEAPLDAQGPEARVRSSARRRP